MAVATREGMQALWLVGAALLQASRAAPVQNPSARSYAVIFDGGSTGTRVHVFSWAKEGPRAASSVDGLPDVLAEPGGNLKVKPGISAFESSPEEAGASILPLIELAERVVPPSEHERTLVMLRATAGMRLLSRRRAQRVYASLFEAVARRGTFRPRRQDFGTLSGDDEGVFGWLCANYLLRRAGRIVSMGAIGALDLGGGSTQITLAAPSGAAAAYQQQQQHAKDRSQIDPRHGVEDVTRTGAPEGGAAPPTVALPGGEVRVFTHSHLGFGNKAVLASFTEAEAAACLAAGVNASWEPCNRSRDYQRYLRAGAMAVMLHGQGDFDRCDEAVRRVLSTFDRAGQPPVHPPPHARRGGPPPPLTRFVAMSLFFYVKHFAHVAGHIPQPDTAAAAGSLGGGARGGSGGSRGGRRRTANSSGGADAESTLASASMLRQAARSLCAYDDAKILTLVGRDPLTTEDALRWRCFDLTYAARLLTDGYGFDADAAVIDFMGDIDGVEVEWTLGALLNEIMLGARSERGGALAHLYHAASDSSGASTRSAIGFQLLKAAAFVALAAAIIFLVPRFCGGTRGYRGGRSRLLAKW